MVDVMSLMKIINRRGPRMLPCGTPETTGSKLEATVINGYSLIAIS